MKILHIAQLYSPVIGGVESLTRLIAEEMGRLGHESIVFTANAASRDEFSRFKFQHRPFPVNEQINGVSVRRFDLNPWWGTLYSDATNKIWGGCRLQKILAGQTLEYMHHGPILQGYVEAIGKIKPDLMLAVNDFPWTIYAACAAKKQYKIPLFLIPSIHTEYSWAHAAILKKVYDDVDCLIVSTEFERSHLIKRGVSDKKIRVVALAINQKLLESPKSNSFREKYHIQNEQPVIMYLGRMTKGKGIEELIKAMRLVWQHNPEAYLILAGKIVDRPYSEKLNRIIQEGNKEHIHQIININDFKDPEIKTIYDAADIFAMPSNVDSFGLVYLEAWASQLPVIACRNTPQESFIEHGKTGYLVDYGNVESLASGIKYLLENREIRVEIGKNGHRQLFKEHTVEIYGQNLLRTYQDFLRG